jgi:hypothetical protein
MKNNVGVLEKLQTFWVIIEPMRTTMLSGNVCWSNQRPSENGRVGRVNHKVLNLTDSCRKSLNITIPTLPTLPK